MNTLEELIYYCKEVEPVGALLLTGEWGCGKTYFIENIFKEEMENTMCVIRISLFGVSSVDEVHNAVKKAWINTYCKDSAIIKKAWNGKEKLSKAEFLPSWLKGIATTEWVEFVDIKEKIGNKSVVLVFDDLERCRLNSVDIFGAINDYCENQKFHTIIVANEDKIHDNHSNLIKAEVLYKEDNADKRKKALLEIDVTSQKNNEKVSYDEIKEKIICRTIKYVPNYSEIIKTIIEEMKFDDAGSYKELLQDCKSELLELFAPDRNNSDDIDVLKRPHNIRSLKCAIKDFYRIYELLRDNDFENISEWLYNFVAYVLASKADIIKDSKNEKLFGDVNLHKLYPAFRSKYVTESIEWWVLHGEWDGDAIISEIALVEEHERAKTPIDIVRTHRIMDVDEEVYIEGFNGVLRMAYDGDLTLDEYVDFIKNNCWSRYYGFTLPTDIDWDEVKSGIKKCINKLISARKEGQQLYHIISEENRNDFSEEEWEAYQIISEFKNRDILVYSNNRATYIEKMDEGFVTANMVCQNKAFDTFDTEMAKVTADAYAKGTNLDKYQGATYFRDMWTRNARSERMKIEESIEGFNMLRSLVESQKIELEEEGKVFAVAHTKQFIAHIDEILQLLKNDRVTVE